MIGVQIEREINLLIFVNDKFKHGMKKSKALKNLLKTDKEASWEQIDRNNYLEFIGWLVFNYLFCTTLHFSTNVFWDFGWTNFH